jgi:hypothetical protein
MFVVLVVSEDVDEDDDEDGEFDDFWLLFGVEAACGKIIDAPAVAVVAAATAVVAD